MKTNQIKKGLVDAALFAGFILTFFLDLTGLDLHQWIGTACGLLAAYHLITHRGWIKAVGERFFGNTSAISRLYYLIDAALLGGFFTILGTGFVISSWLALSLTNYEAWHAVHVTASVITLLVLMLKIGVHWRWIVTTARKLTTRPSAPQAVPQPVVQMDSRREFMKVMGVTGAAAAIALGSAIHSLQEASAQAAQTGSEALAQANTASSSAPVVSTAASTATAAPTAQTAATATSVPTAQVAANTAACSVRCNRKCSYPGHCRRYTDSNGNGRCDLGECM